MNHGSLVYLFSRAKHVISNFEPVIMIALESGHKSRPWLNGKHPKNESKVEFALGCSSAHI